MIKELESAVTCPLSSTLHVPTTPSKIMKIKKIMIHKIPLRRMNELIQNPNCCQKPPSPHKLSNVELYRTNY